LDTIRVLTTTDALGTKADILLFSIVRNNPERQVGAVESFKDLNVAISRSKEKLFLVGSFEMMLNGWLRLSINKENDKKNLTRKLAYLIDKK
jgi:superfamily I DNA and/or RNA helicase